MAGGEESPRGEGWDFVARTQHGAAIARPSRNSIDHYWQPKSVLTHSHVFIMTRRYKKPSSYVIVVSMQ